MDSRAAPACHELQAHNSLDAKINTLPATSSSGVGTRALAFLSASLLVGASATFGGWYAYTQGSQHGPLMAGAAVAMALGLEIAKPLAVAGFVGSIFRRPGQALALMALGTIAVAYSLTAELSLMATGRADAAAERTSSSGKAIDARAKVRALQAEIAAVGHTRGAGEVQAELSAALLDKRLNGCEGWLANVQLRATCIERVAPLKAELARAERKADLAAQLTEAEGGVATAGPEREADPGAKALATFLAGVGVVVEPGRLADWIVLVGVLALEIGSAMAGVLVSSSGATKLAGKVAMAHAVNQTMPPVTTDRARVALPKPTKDHGEPAASPAPGSLNNDAPQDPPDEPSDSAGDARAIQGDSGDAASADASGPLGPWLTKVPVGRPVQVSQRELGEVVGLSQASVSRALRTLRDAGAIQVVSGAGGTCITRLAAGA